MITPEKIAETEKMIQNGSPAGEVREQLRREGYSEEEIGLCFKVHRYDMRMWYLVSAILILLFSIWRVMQGSGPIPFGFSGIMFFAYYREKKRLHDSK